VAAVLVSLTAEPGLTGLGGGGYMLVVAPGAAPALLDFFVEAPGRGGGEASAELVPVVVDFGDAVQVFNTGPASVGTHGVPAGLCEAAQRFGSLPLADLAAPGAQLARDGVPLNSHQAYVVELLAGIVTATPECSAVFAPEGKLLREGDVLRQPELAETIERLGRDGADPFYAGDIGTAVADWLQESGTLLGEADLAAYEVIDREPVRARYRGREVLMNPPPSAGGALIALALALLEEAPGQPGSGDLVAAMQAAQEQRTPEFLEGLAEEGFFERFMAARRGATTHISVLDDDGLACSVTCSNGEGSGIVVPGTGIHLNNMMGEQDLNPLGFHRHPPGRRMPSMMCPTVVRTGDAPELVLGSGGSNRIRSAILQTMLGVIDGGLDIAAAVAAPRLHFEDGVVYAEPGAAVDAVEQAGYAIARFKERNLFFGGVQAVARDPGGELRGGADPRRGGGVAVA
jgi:gamma-glutamyltranspeptidase/glutathione hydrolase